MNFDFLKVITGRRFPIEYIAPPVCEGEFSSTGSPFISLLPIIKESIDTLEVTFQDGVFTFSWDSVPGALCYTVWKETETAEWEIVAECIDPNEWETNEEGCYKVTVISEEGSSSLEDAPKKCTTTAFSCPTFSVLLPASVSAAQGVDVTFTVTAATTTPPADLVYTWKKDGTIILTEVLASGTPSSIVKADVTPADDGTYSVEVTVVGKDCAPIVSSCVLTVDPTPPIPTCEDDPGPMPASFLEDDSTLIGEFTGTILGTDELVPGGISGGEYSISYVSGSFVQCLKTVTGFYPCATASRYRSERSIGGRLKINDIVVASFGGLDTAIESGTCPLCDPVNECENTPSIADAIANCTTFHGAGPGVTTDSSGVVAHTWGVHSAKVYCSEPIFPPDACEATIDTVVALTRTKKYIDQPMALQVLSWATVWGLIKPVGAIDQSWPYGNAWTGFSDLPGITDLTVIYQLGVVSYPVVDFVDLAGSIISAFAGDKWALQFFGYWFDGGGDHWEILWAGEKLGGDSAAGAYSRTSAWNVVTPTCVVLTE
jgi:hypothetical protein